MRTDNHNNLQYITIITFLLVTSIYLFTYKDQVPLPILLIFIPAILLLILGKVNDWDKRIEKYWPYSRSNQSTLDAKAKEKEFAWENFSNKDNDLVTTITQKKSYAENFKINNNIMCMSTFFDEWDPSNITMKMPDVANEDNAIEVKVVGSEDQLSNAQQRRDVIQNIFSVNLGKKELSIKPKNVLNLNSGNSFHNFNQRDFTICWNMKFDSKVFKNVQLKETDEQPHKFEIFRIRGYHSASPQHTEYTLIVNYCIDLAKDTKTVLRYLEVTLDDRSTLPETENEDIVKNRLNRYLTEKTKIIAYNDVDKNLETISKDFHNFMMDDNEHTFMLSRQGNTLSLYIDAIKYTKSEMKEINLINKMDITDPNNPNKQDDSDIINFFSNNVTFEKTGKDPGVFFNSQHKLIDTKSYVNFFSVYTRALTKDERKQLSSTLKSMAIRYRVLSTDLINNELDKYKKMGKENIDMKERLEHLEGIGKECKFTDPEVCKACENSKNVTNWHDLKDIFLNADSDCLKNMVNHCVVEPDDKDCQFNKKVIDKLNGMFNKESDMEALNVYFQTNKNVIEEELDEEPEQEYSKADFNVLTLEEQKKLLADLNRKMGVKLTARNTEDASLGDNYKAAMKMLGLA
jgi:hypothetical protein